MPKVDFLFSKMPRSFLVKKHINSAKKPNYSELESPAGKVSFDVFLFLEIKQQCSLSKKFKKLCFPQADAFHVCFLNFAEVSFVSNSLDYLLWNLCFSLKSWQSHNPCCLFFFQCSSHRTSTRLFPCQSSPSQRSWARRRTAPSQCGLPATCRYLRSPVTSLPSLDTPHRSPTPPLKTTAAPRARGAMKTSRCCPS